MTFTAKIAGSALVASLALGLAAPASAAPYGTHARGWNSGGELRQQIVQLDRQVDRARRSGILAGREGRQLAQRVDRIEAKWREFSYRGFTRTETRQIQTMIYEIERRIDLRARNSDRFERDQRYARNNRNDGRRGYRR